MSAPIAETLTVWTPLAVLLASLLGSAHCAGMCGALVISVCKTRTEWVGYQLGRWLAYASLGLAAGALGKRLLASSQTLQWLAWGAALTMAAAFILMGIRVWQGRVPHFKLLPTSALAFFYRIAGRTPLLLGFLSAALPCGWLQSFALGAAASQDPLAGALLMTTFWLGTLPALAATPWVAKRIARPVLRGSPRVAAVLLIAVGLAGVGLKMKSLVVGPEEPAHCHHSH